METFRKNLNNLYKKLYLNRNIYIGERYLNIIKICDELVWQGRLLRQTKHFALEFYTLHKNYEYIIKILTNGEHYLISKRQQKYNVYFPFKGKYLCLSYVIDGNTIILIHIKPIRRIK